MVMSVAVTKAFLQRPIRRRRTPEDAEVALREAVCRRRTSGAAPTAALWNLE